jgi:hypothetical protein
LNKAIRAVIAVCAFSAIAVVPAASAQAASITVNQSCIDRGSPETGGGLVSGSFTGAPIGADVDVYANRDAGAFAVNYGVDADPDADGTFSFTLARYYTEAEMPDTLWIGAFYWDGFQRQLLAETPVSVCSSDPDNDGDGVADSVDNCPTTANADQSDNDGDGIGNACDPTPDPAPEPIYAFDGFYAPVNNRDAQGNFVFNKTNAGAAIPVKFSLGGDYGLDIFEAGYPKSEVIACNSQAEVDGIEETVTAGNSSLSYAAGSDTYTYVWKTSKAWEDTCRQLVVKFDDGTTARANFRFH